MDPNSGADAAEPKARVKRERPAWVKWLKRTLAAVFLIMLLAGVILGGMLLNEVNKTKSEIPHIEELMASISIPPSQIVSADGVVIQKFAQQYRDPVQKLDEVPKLVQNAIIAAEDRRFWTHGGVDFWALCRVAFMGATTRHFSAGGSTLEMQLAKIVAGNSAKTFGRKLHDIALAYNISRELSKQEILKLYLNQVYFGSGAYGIKAAAQVYFAKPLDDLSAAEAAMLARCVRRPSDENPFKNLEKSIENRNVVLLSMLKEKMISDADYEKSISAKVVLNRRPRAGNSSALFAPYFVNHVKHELETTHPDLKLEDGGITVQTTLDSRVQKIAEEEVHDIIRHGNHLFNTAAFVVMNAKGEIVAEVGGDDYRKNQFNIISQGRRQPGSSFKPFVYSTAILEKGYTPDTYLSNQTLTYVNPESGAAWTPKNSSRSENAPGYTMRTALALSVNIPAAHTILDVGPENVVKLAHDVFGFTSELRAYPSLSLGASEVSPLEMAQAYSVFMLRGNRATPHTIVSIKSPDVEMMASEDTVARNVLNPSVCDMIDGMLRAVVTSGTGTAAAIIPDAKGKTGTTSENKDAWFCGYSRGLIGVGWVGNQRYDAATKSYEMRSMGPHTFGGTVTAKLWANIMRNLPGDLVRDSQQTLEANWNRPPVDVSSSVAADAGKAKDDGNIVDVSPPLDPNSPTTEPGHDPGEGPDNSRQLPDNNAPPANPDDGNQTKAATNPVSEPVRPVAPRPKPAEKLVAVEICEETNLAANIYCPTTVVKYFRPGHLPKHCKLHHG